MDILNKSALLFWMWNDELNPEEIRKQIHQMKQQHADGFFIHAMPTEFRPKSFPDGLPGYLSDYWFQMVRYAVEEAQKCDMSVWLYDEGGWPSGLMCGRIVAEHPELRAKSIRPDGSIAIRDDRTDLLNPLVTQIFLDGVHEKYAASLRPYFGNTIAGIFTDEPICGHFTPETELPWTPAMPDRFLQSKGYPLQEALNRIFTGQDPQAREDFCDVWLQMFEDAYLIPYHSWCRKNGLLFTGHFNGDESKESILRFSGGALQRLLKHMDIPGCDMLLHQMHPTEPETPFAALPGSIPGKLHISESFAVTGPNLSLAEMKYAANMQAIQGIEIIAPMAIHYSNRGARHLTTASNLFSPDPRWDFYHHFADYTHRLSGVFRRTVPIVKATVNYPSRSYQRGEETPSDAFAEAVKCMQNQMTFQFAENIPGWQTHADLQLIQPCPELRTRHLRSPRGERWILANQSLDSLTATFQAPPGVLRWYDPATGKISPVYPDAQGILHLSLPFAGCLVLLSLPSAGRKSTRKTTQRTQEASPAICRELSIPAPSACEIMTAGADGILWNPAPKNLTVNRDFCGRLRWQWKISLPDSSKITALELPDARSEMYRLFVNGSLIGEAVWSPYRFSLQGKLQPGENLLELERVTSAAAALHSPEHQAILKERQYENSYIRWASEFSRLFPEEPFPGKVLLVYSKI